MPPFIDLSGKRFGRLTVESRFGTTSYGQPIWRCRCDCGAVTDVYGNALRSGVSQSCGCARLDAITTHGATGTPEFTIWQMMRQRCNNQSHKSYPSYGGRGIKVCQRWEESFAVFLADVGKRPSAKHTLDRRNNDLGYHPGNCYWATPLQQARNKRSNRFLEFNGEFLTINEWCRRLGMKKNTLLNRLAKGMSATEALSVPVAHKSGQGQN